MHTRVPIDETLLEEAHRSTGIPSARDVVELALVALVRARGEERARHAKLALRRRAGRQE